VGDASLRQAAGLENNSVIGSGLRVLRIFGKEASMLYWAVVFLIVALIAGLLGFGAIAFAAAGIAKILFFIFLIAFLVSLVMHLGRHSSV